MGDSLCCLCCEIICAILLPPLGVIFRHGCCSLEFCICLVLTILGYVPGIIYAIYVICAVDRHQHHRRDPDEYYYVA